MCCYRESEVFTFPPPFTWEQRKFSELYQKINEKNDLSFGTDKIISVANMYYKKETNINSTEEYMKTYNIFRLGDIAFEGNKSKDYSYGRFMENDIGDGIVSHVFDVFRPIVRYDLWFWKYLINNENVMAHVLRRVTTKATMMNNLVAKDFLKATILIPNIEEQSRIGEYFKQLDNLITLHQREVILIMISN
ncbi:restriction endonuclease subunit S [Clostridium tetani]|uniref:restriction endonuclease subunit S n=1 Tax=Clostridium tetani TaxID=1513 RepID=UPI00100ABD60|nr:restriction endonuclease subunit S [Clostridium tetani]RXM57975.1 restriction endonuclease subunit S [Clostridium tetani]